jgi:hypothetical protein
VTEGIQVERPAARRRKRLAAGALAVIALLAAGFSPAARTGLRESFTRMPSEYTELYFGSTEPTLTGAGAAASVLVPVSLLHHGAAPQSFTVRAAITAVGGGAAATGATVLAGVPGRVASAVLTLRVPGRATAYVVDVTLPGHPQALHFRLDTAAAG